MYYSQQSVWNYWLIILLWSFCNSFLELYSKCRRFKWIYSGKNKTFSKWLSIVAHAYHPFCKQGLTPYSIYSGLPPFYKIGAIYTYIKYWMVIRMAEGDFINFSKIHSKKCWKIYQWRLPSVTLVLSDPLIIGITKVPQKHTIL